ncbi:hypothetical protein BH11PSE11_BH11PSE11_07350 [soil metagenome]
MAHQIAKLLMFCGILLLGLALWRKDILPEHHGLRQELLQEPDQREVQRAAFQKTVAGVVYTIQPVYRYELYGMVVSRHDAHTWWDYLHAEWNDNLNVTDLCVVWGNNVRSDNLRNIEFSSGQFTCNFSTRSSEAFAAFDQSAISNNHLLSGDKWIAKKLREADIGDQIRFRGYLAEYSHHHGFPFKRGTSTVRTDTGNGACETVYVEEFEILERGGRPWRALLYVALAMLIAGVIAWFVLPVRAEF